MIPPPFARPGEPLVAIVIVNYETSAMVRRCVESLARQTQPHTVVIVDNPSPARDADNLTDLVTADGERSPSTSTVSLIRAPENLGYGRGCNLGLAGASAPYLCILNPDTALPPGALQAWLEAMREAEASSAGKPPVGLLAPRLLNDNGTPQRSTYQFQNALNYWLYHSLFAGILKTLRKRVGHPGSGPTNRERDASGHSCHEVDWVMGAAMLLPREAWERIGGFSEDYFLYAEDTDLCWRLRQAGYRVLFAPTVSINHTQGEPSPERRGQNLVRLFRGLHTFIHLNYGFWKRNGVRLAVITDMLIRIALYAPLSLLRPGHTLTRTRLQGSLEVLRMYLH